MVEHMEHRTKVLTAITTMAMVICFADAQTPLSISCGKSANQEVDKLLGDVKRKLENHALPDYQTPDGGLYDGRITRVRGVRRTSSTTVNCRGDKATVVVHSQATGIEGEYFWEAYRRSVFMMGPSSGRAYFSISKADFDVQISAKQTATEASNKPRLERVTAKRVQGSRVVLEGLGPMASETATRRFQAEAPGFVEQEAWDVVEDVLRKTSVKVNP